MASGCAPRSAFYPKADAAILACKLAPPPDYPKTVGPIYDSDNVQHPILAWPSDAESYYPPPKDAFGTAGIPEKLSSSERYMRAFLAKNERLRLSMLWYYTYGILDEADFLSGLQEKVSLAKETTMWEFAIVGILDVNHYTRLAAIGVPLGILPRGETLCAHTVTQPPGSVFLLPSLMEDWRFAKSPYCESGGLHAYAGVPLRLQHESGETVCLGSLCVASSSSREPLTRGQQTALVRLADWIVNDIIHLTRARRQRERRRMGDLIAQIQAKSTSTNCEESVIELIRTVYPGAVVNLQSSKGGRIEIQGRDSVAQSDLSEGLWEDVDYIDEYIAHHNHLEVLPTNRVIRLIAASCESVLGHSYLTLGTKDLRLVFDDIDAWFIQTCAGIIAQMWHKRLLEEAMLAKESFLRGFSHQLRTPVHGILSSVELLAEELKSFNTRELSKVSEAAALLQTTSASIPGDDHGSYLDTIKRAGRDLISIINSMITLNRWADIAATERHYATHVIYELEKELSDETNKFVAGDPRYNASLIFTHSILPDYCSIQTDLGLLRDSILPLIINAIQNTPNGVVAVAISVHPETDELVVDVTDTGRGIPPEDQQRIFELYEQVDVYSTGAGLGLTLASRFAALLGGTVELVSSEFNRGSHFRASFQGVEVAHTDSSLLTQPLVPRFVNLPKQYHIISSRPDETSLGQHAANFLTCYGMTSSDDICNTLIIADFVDDADQHLEQLSKLPEDQIILCHVPYPEGEATPNTSLKNVIYVHGPFLTPVLSSALERANALLQSWSQHNTAALVQSMDDLVIEPELENDKAEARITHETDLAQPLPTSTSERNPGSKASHQIASLESPIAHIGPGFPHHALTSCPTALLVDDNAINLRVMQMYCIKRNLPYICAKDGLEAIEKFKSHQEHAISGKTSPIQLILMDLQMPRCDGIEATRQIRQLEEENAWEKSALFVVTGQDSRADRKAVGEVGGQEYFVKPVSIKSLDTGLKQYFPCFNSGV